MTDPSGPMGPTPEREGDATNPWSAAPPPPPPPSDPVEARFDDGVEAPTLVAESEESVRRGGIGGRVVAGIVGAVLLVGGVGFAATQMGSDDGDPEQAVRDLFDAASDEDVLGMLAALDPGERDTLADPVQDMFDELERLEVLDDSFDPTSVSGLDIEVSDLELRVDPVRDDLVRVALVGGTVTTGFDTDELAVGDFVADTLDRFEVPWRGLRDSGSESIDNGLGDFLAVHRSDDGWRVSVAYTVAEAARLDAGVPMPAAAEGLTPIGADSPEEAVRGMVEAAVRLDLAGVVAHLSPDEFGVVHDYWPLFFDDVPDPAELAGAPTIDIVSLDLRSEGSGSRAEVFVDGFDVEVEIDGSTIGVAVGDGCLELRGDLDELDVPDELQVPLCADDLDSLAQDGLGLGGFDGEGLDIPSLDDLTFPAIGIGTSRIDGDWYVAPIRTVADAAVAGLGGLERSDLDQLVDGIESFFSSFESGFDSGFDSGFEFDSDFDDGFGSDDSDGFSSKTCITLDEDGSTVEVPCDDDSVVGFGDDFFEDDPFTDDPSTDDELGTDDFEPFPEDDPYGYSQLPRPGGDDDPIADEAWAAIGEYVASVTGDDEVTACAMKDLQTFATTSELYEIADWYLYGYEPREVVVRIFEAAIDGCTG